jgi:hypothetical protein
MTAGDKIRQKRLRRQAWHRSPVPAALVGEFTESEHAIITIVVDTIRRAGGEPCALCPADIVTQAGAGEGCYQSALRKARGFGMLATERRGQHYVARILWVEDPEDIKRELGRALAEELAREVGDFDDQVEIGRDVWASRGFQPATSRRPSRRTR